MKSARQTRDIVVVGGSAGGIHALCAVLGGLKAGFAASVFVVLHVHPSLGSLGELLLSFGPLPAAYATHGDRIERGRVYVAPPDNHLTISDGCVEVVRGPRENGHRPSIDALFRSAAVAYGPRVVGILLSGYYRCGTEGMRAIKACGGVLVAQDPDDARIGDLPRHAIEHAEVDHVAPASEIAALLEQLVSTTIVAPARRRMPGPKRARLHDAEAGRALWAAIRALEDGAEQSERMAAASQGELKDRFADRARSQLGDARIIRALAHDAAGRRRA